MATGAMDRDLWNRAFLMTAFGQTPTEASLEEMHPLRRLYKRPPTPEQMKASAEMAMTILGKGLAHLNQHRKG